MKKLTVEEMHRMDVAAFKAAAKCGVTVVLDNVRSMHNVGSVFRTCDAFRIERLVLCGITPCPPMAEIHKTALGAEDSIEWVYAPSALETVMQLKTAGYECWAIEQVEDSVALADFVADPGRKYALVLGNEVKGVAQEVVDACHGAIEIPQYGTKHSLNVSVTAGIVLYEIAGRLLNGR